MTPQRARRRPRTAALPTDPIESARIAGLRYVPAEGPGITRKKEGDGFVYTGPDGRKITDEDTLARIHGLVIPPAWTSVWISPLKNAHLQAVGRDARGRKQYRYHPLYRAIRDQTKYSRMTAFAAALPKIRERVKHDMALPDMPREKVLATVVRLLETTCIRIGNEEYAKDNNSFGLTTMQENHAKVTGSKVRFRFRGKSGQFHDIELTNKRMARIIYECQSIPGHELFHFVDEKDNVCKIGSEDVNEYLHEITGLDFTAKDFRTWVGTGQAAAELVELGPASSETELKKNVVAAVKNVSAKLGNKPATCRKYYVHPAVLDAYSNGTLFDIMRGDAPIVDGLKCEECKVLALIASWDTRQAVANAKAAA